MEGGGGSLGDPAATGSVGKKESFGVVAAELSSSLISSLSLFLRIVGFVGLVFLFAIEGILVWFCWA